MRNAQLIAELQATIDELRASRRLVEAQDAERRKIEQNLHDGAQQQLIALAIQLGLLAESADDPDLLRKAIPDLKAQLSAALDDLRALAHGIYPPLLAERGLVMALHAQAARSPVPVLLEADQVGRYPQDTETTVYFCTLEALQDMVKHARASQAMVRLSGSAQGLSSSRSVTTGQDFRPPGCGTASACRACRTGSPRAAGHWTSALSRGGARPLLAGCLRQSGRQRPGLAWSDAADQALAPRARMDEPSDVTCGPPEPAA